MLAWPLRVGEKSSTLVEPKAVSAWWSRLPASSPDSERRLLFPKSIRLRTRRDYLRVQRGGIRIPSKDLLVFYRKNEKKHSRFGTTVSKKVGNAVVRNRVKRRLREAIRHHQHHLQASVDVVFIASPRAATLPFGILERDVLNALHQIANREQ